MNELSFRRNSEDPERVRHGLNIPMRLLPEDSYAARIRELFSLTIPVMSAFDEIVLPDDPVVAVTLLPLLWSFSGGNLPSIADSSDGKAQRAISVEGFEWNVSQTIVQSTDAYTAARISSGEYVVINDSGNSLAPVMLKQLARELNCTDEQLRIFNLPTRRIQAVEQGIDYIRDILLAGIGELPLLNKRVLYIPGCHSIDGVFRVIAMHAFSGVWPKVVRLDIVLTSVREIIDLQSLIKDHPLVIVPEPVVQAAIKNLEGALCYTAAAALHKLRGTYEGQSVGELDLECSYPQGTDGSHRRCSEHATSVVVDEYKNQLYRCNFHRGVIRPDVHGEIRFRVVRS